MPTAEEADYVCGTLNSTPARLFVASYAVGTQMSTHIASYIHIPSFDRHQADHRALATASRAAHTAAAAEREPDQDAVDRAAAGLWGISWSEIEAMREFFDRLRKRA